METELVGKNEAVIKLDEDELRILNNALNEVCHGLDLIEFHTRMGAELKEVKMLLKQIRGVIDLMKETRVV